MRKLPPATQRDMRAQAHHLKPVVTVSDNGLSPAVLAEIEASLQAHELIKIRVFGFEREDRGALMTQICQTLEASPVQHIGKLLIIWRARKEDDAPKSSANMPNRRNAGAKNKSAKAFAHAAQRAALMAEARKRQPRSPARPGNLPQRGRI